MAGITLEQAQQQLDRYMDAETAVLLNQSYEISGRKLTRANLIEIQTGIKVWNERVKDITQKTTNGRGRSVTVCPGW